MINAVLNCTKSWLNGNKSGLNCIKLVSDQHLIPSNPSGLQAMLCTNSTLGCWHYFKFLCWSRMFQFEFPQILLADIYFKFLCKSRMFPFQFPQGFDARICQIYRLISFSFPIRQSRDQEESGNSYLLCAAFSGLILRGGPTGLHSK